MPEFNTILEALKNLSDEILDEQVIEEKVYWTRDIGSYHQDSIFHFVASPSDFSNIIDSSALWANKRNHLTKHTGQYDINADELSKKFNKKYGYICFTQHSAKVAYEYDRPFGIEFDKHAIDNYLDQNEQLQLLDYNQFKQKTLGYVNKDKISKDKKISQLIKTSNSSSKAFNDVRLCAVGKLKTGKAFIAIQNWKSRLLNTDIDDALYNKLITWMRKVTPNGLLLHFINDSALNRKSVPAREFLSAIDHPNKNAITHKYINLDKPLSTGFDEIDEIYAVCAIIEYGLVTKGARGNTTNEIPPLWNLDNTTTEEILSELSDQQLSDLTDLAIDDTALSDLSDIFNEYEQRLYLPDARDFYFESNDVKSLWLPEIFAGTQNRAQRYVYLKNIFEAFDAADILDTKAIADICNKNMLNTSSIINSIYTLYETIKQSRLPVTFYKYEDDPELKKLPKDVSNINTDDLHTPSKSRTRDNQRYVTSSEILDVIYSETNVGTPNTYAQDIYNTDLFLLHDEKGNPSLIYRKFKTKTGLVMAARIGAEAIILGTDASGEIYLKLIDKGNFLELPGGSFDKKPNSDSDVIEFMKRKIKKETGLSTNDISSLQLFDGDGIYMYEGKPTDYIKKITKDMPALKWFASYYCLVGAVYKDVIDKKALDLDTSENAGGEISRWIKLRQLTSNNEFMRRYANIMPYINQLKDNL